MNRKVIVAVLVIGGSGIMRAWLSKPPAPITPVILGSYVFLLILAIMDTFGGYASELAGAFAMLAMVYILLTEFPWKTIIDALQPKTGGQSAGNFGTQQQPPTVTSL